MLDLKLVLCIVGSALGLAPVAPHRALLHRRGGVAVRAEKNGDGKTDVIDEFFPRFRRDVGAVDEDEAAAAARKAPVEGARMNTVNAKLLADIEKAKGGYRVEGPIVEETVDVDVSDVSPAQSVLSGFAALGAAYVFYLGVDFASAAFDAAPPSTDFYPVTRMSQIMRTVVIGLGSLLTGITAFAGVGLLALGAKVAADPAAPPKDS